MYSPVKLLLITLWIYYSAFHFWVSSLKLQGDIALIWVDVLDHQCQAKAIVVTYSAAMLY
jgi:hypothetical protein